MNPVPESVVNRFSSFNPSPEDARSVVDLVRQILQHPDLGIPIPFDKPEYDDCYVALTPNGRWRVVYRRLNPEGVIIVSVDPE